MLNCKQASKLTSKQLDGDLTLTEKISLKFHLAMCVVCAEYNKQLKLIKNAVNSTSHDDNENMKLSKDFKDQLRNSINSKNRKN